MVGDVEDRAPALARNTRRRSAAAATAKLRRKRVPFGSDYVGCETLDGCGGRNGRRRKHDPSGIQGTDRGGGCVGIGGPGRLRHQGLCARQCGCGRPAPERGFDPGRGCRGHGPGRAGPGDRRRQAGRGQVPLCRGVVRRQHEVRAERGDVVAGSPGPAGRLCREAEDRQSQRLCRGPGPHRRLRTQRPQLSAGRATGRGGAPLSEPARRGAEPDQRDLLRAGRAGRRQ